MNSFYIERLLSFFYGCCIVLTGFIISLVIYLIKKFCCKKSDTQAGLDTRRSSLRSQRNQQQICRNRFPIIVIQEDNSAPLNSSDDECSDIYNSTAAASIYNIDHLDLPPTYANSTENLRSVSQLTLPDAVDDSTRVLSVSVESSHSLLPTYEEALSSSMINILSQCEKCKRKSRNNTRHNNN